MGALSGLKHSILFFGHRRPQFLEPGEEQLENRRGVCLAVTHGQIDRWRFTSSGRLTTDQGSRFALYPTVTAGLSALRSGSATTDGLGHHRHGHDIRREPGRQRGDDRELGTRSMGAGPLLDRVEQGQRAGQRCAACRPAPVDRRECRDRLFRAAPTRHGHRPPGTAATGRCADSRHDSRELPARHGFERHGACLPRTRSRP